MHLVVAVAVENIAEVISRNGAELTVLRLIKIRVHSDYLDPTVVGTDQCSYLRSGLVEIVDFMPLTN